MCRVERRRTSHANSSRDTIYRKVGILHVDAVVVVAAAIVGVVLCVGVCLLLPPHEKPLFAQYIILHTFHHKTRNSMVTSKHKTRFRQNV